MAIPITEILSIAANHRALDAAHEKGMSTGIEPANIKITPRSVKVLALSREDE